MLCRRPEIIPRHRWGMFFDPPDPYLAPHNDFRFWSKNRFFSFFRHFSMLPKEILAPPQNRTQLAPNCSEPPKIEFYGPPKVSAPTHYFFYATERARADFVFRDAHRNPNFGTAQLTESKKYRNLIILFRSVGALPGGQKSNPGTAGPCFSTTRTHTSHL